MYVSALQVLVLAARIQVRRTHLSAPPGCRWFHRYQGRRSAEPPCRFGRLLRLSPALPRGADSGEADAPCSRLIGNPSMPHEHYPEFPGMQRTHPKSVLPTTSAGLTVRTYSQDPVR
jgi:hypothetical protein